MIIRGGYHDGHSMGETLAVAKYGLTVDNDFIIYGLSFKTIPLERCANGGMFVDVFFAFDEEASEAGLVGEVSGGTVRYSYTVLYVN